MSKPTFNKDTFRLTTGTVAGQAILLLAAPVLTRLFTPEAFGFAALFTSISMIVGSSACLRLEQAIVIPECEDDARHLLSICFIFSIIFGTGVAVVLFPFRGFTIFDHSNRPEWIAGLLVFSVTMTGFQLALSNWNLRRSLIGSIAVSKALTSTTASALQVVLGAIGKTGAPSLIAGHAAGTAFGLIPLLCSLKKKDRPFIQRSLNPRKLIAVFLRYKNYPLYNTPSNLFSSLAIHLPAVLMLAYFPAAAAGSFALAFRVLALPMHLAGTAIGQVFYQRASIAAREESLQEITAQTANKLILLSVTPFAILFLIAPSAFRFLFGPEWIQAGTFAQLLAPYFLINFIGAPLAGLNNILEKQKIGMFFNSFNFIIRCGSLTLGGLIQRPEIAVLVFSLGSTIVVLLYNQYHLKQIGLGLPSLARTALKYLPETFICVAPVLCVLALSPQNLLLTLAFGGVGLCMHFCYLGVVHKETFKLQ